MADQKITALTAVTAPADADVLAVVQDTATTPVTKKITWTVIKAFLKTYFDTLYSAFTPSTMFEIFDDFLSGMLTSGNIGDLGWRVTLSGDASISSRNNTTGWGELGIHFGNGSGNIVIFLNKDTSPTVVDGGNYNGLRGGETITFRIRFPSVENIKTWFGMGNGGAVGVRPDRGTYFELDTSVNANLRGVFDNDSATNFTSGQVVTTGYHTFKIVVNSDATSAEFFYDGSSMGSLTLSGTRVNDSQGIFIGGAYSGTNGKEINVDYVRLQLSGISRG